MRLGNGSVMESPGQRNAVLRYLAIVRSARDFGLSQDEIETVAGPFDRRNARCEQLADALADLILARAAPFSGGSEA